MLFDVSHRGAVTPKALGHVMRNLGMLTDEQELADMIDEVDADGEYCFILFVLRTSYGFRLSDTCSSTCRPPCSPEEGRNDWG